MSEQWTVEAIEKKRWLAEQHRGREGELAALDKIEELLELQGELTAALKNLVERKLIKDADGDHYDEVLEAIAKTKGVTNEHF